MKLDFSQQIFKKSLNVKCHQNHPVGAKLFPADGWMDGWTDRQDEAHCYFSQFCEHA
jgi:hypothetical protein